MKKKYIAILAAAAGLCSCVDMMESASEAEIVNPLAVSFKVKAMSGFVDADGNGEIDPNFPVEGLTVRYTNFEEDASFESQTDASGMARTKVAPGNYTISVFGETEDENGVTYYLNGSVQNKAITADITDEQAEASNDFSIAIRPAKVGPLCFSQIFYCGSTNPETSSTYFRDQFYEIYNNGDEVCYLDHLCFAQLVPAFATATLPQWPAEDGLNNYVYAQTVWQLPGNGNDYPLKPGESFVIVQEAANHADHSKYGGIVDTSMAEFEVWTGNAGRVNENVPDLRYAFWSGFINKMQWLTSVMGSALCIYQPGYQLEFSPINTGVVGETTQKQVGGSQEFVRIPAEQLIDGVEMIPTSTSLNMKRIPGFVDAGAASTNDIYVGLSVCRKVVGRRADGTPLYSDTNNSSEDFELQAPKIRPNGEKMPAWNWSLK